MYYHDRKPKKKTEQKPTTKQHKQTNKQICGKHFADGSHHANTDFPGYSCNLLVLDRSCVSVCLSDLSGFTRLLIQSKHHACESAR